MSQHQQSIEASNNNTPTRVVFFGPPPLLEGEDAAAYDALLAEVSGAVNPSDIIEEIWARDVVDITWEILRWRRLKANVLTTAMIVGLEQSLVRPLKLELHLEQTIRFKPNPAKDLAHAWAANDPSAIKRVDELLTSVGATMETVQARALVWTLNNVERIDRLTKDAEMRRNAVLREIDRRRDHKTFAQALRAKVRDVEGAEFKRLETKTITPNDVIDKHAA
jgi:hypothetical protein